MTKTTLSEETQELLDEVCDVELALDFIENHENVLEQLNQANLPESGEGS